MKEFLRRIRERFCRHEFQMVGGVDTSIYCPPCNHVQGCNKTVFIYKCTKCGMTKSECKEIYQVLTFKRADGNVEPKVKIKTIGRAYSSVSEIGCMNALESLRWVKDCFPLIDAPMNTADEICRKIHLVCEDAIIWFEILLEDYDKTRERLVNLEQKKWISVDKEQPKNTEKVIALIRGFSRPTVLYYDGVSFHDEDYNYYHVTHWMPMPELPSEVRQNE